MKNNLKWLLGIIAAIILTACSESLSESLSGESEESNKQSKLCTQIEGDTGYIYCTWEGYECKDGFDLEDIYPTYDSCSVAEEAFISNFENGGSGGSDSSSGSTTSGSCGVTTASFVDAQYDFTCNAACTYRSAGQTEAVSSYCGLLDGYSQLGGPGSEGCSACQ